MATQLSAIAKGYVTRSQGPLIDVSQVEGLENEIDTFVRDRLNTNTPEAQAAQREISIAKDTLQKSKATLLAQQWRHSPLRTTGGNLINPSLRSVLSTQTVHQGRFPQVGFYNDASEWREYEMAICSQLIRLHPAQACNLPESVKRAIGDVRGKKVDYFLSFSDAVALKRSNEKIQRPLIYNLSTHAWAQPDYRTGGDRSIDVQMGIFEGRDVYEVKTGSGVGFGYLKPMSVHCHPTDNGATALSPNNAHFGVNPNASFSTFWSVCMMGDRAVVTEHLIINEFDFVTMPLATAFQQGGSLAQIIQKVQTVPFTSQLLSLAADFELGAPDAMRKFQALKPHHQNAIFGRTWQDKWNAHFPNQAAPHADFGRLSFQSDPSLDANHHCTGKDRSTILRNYCAQLSLNYINFVTGLETLLAAPREVPVNEKMRTFKPIVEAFQRGDEAEGMRLFNVLEPRHKHGVFAYVWDLEGRPMDFPGDFGSASFYADARVKLERRCDRDKRLQAILSYIHSI